MTAPLARRLAAGLFLLATPALAQPPAAPQPAVAATVNGEPIPLDRVDAVLKRRPPAAPLSASQTKALRTEVANDLIDDLLLRQFLRKHAPKCEPGEIDRHLKALADAQARRGQTLADYLAETGQTVVEVRETWADMIQLSRYVQQKVTTDQLRQYYDANKDHFDRAEVRASHVLVRVPAAAPAADREAARRKLGTLRAEIAAGQVSFTDAARKHSQCPSAADGGDLGFLPRKGNGLGEVFTRALFALQPGAVSAAVESEAGFHLIRATDRKPGVPSAFETCLPEVRDQFADDFRAELVAKLRQQAEVRVSVP